MIVLVLLGGGAYGYVTYLAKQNYDKVAIEAQKVQEEIKMLQKERSKDPTAGWRIGSTGLTASYRNEEYGFEFKYPGDWEDPMVKNYEEDYYIPYSDKRRLYITLGDKVEKCFYGDKDEIKGYNDCDEAKIKLDYIESSEEEVAKTIDDLLSRDFGRTFASYYSNVTRNDGLQIIKYSEADATGGGSCEYSPLDKALLIKSEHLFYFELSSCFTGGDKLLNKQLFDQILSTFKFIN